MNKRIIPVLFVLLLILTGCTKETCAAHTDTNGDDICDTCKQSVLVIVDLYCINDLHGRILDSGTQPGIDELTTFLDSAKETDDHVILLSAGDMWQGSAESNLTKGQLVTDWMNSLDFAAMALGNHEFDWGEDYIADNAQLADFPFLAINVYDSQTDMQAAYCKSSVMVECGGIQVGIIGAIGDCYSSIAPDMVRDVYFKTGDALTELVMAESEALRTQGADLIVYILHDGSGSSTNGAAVTVDGEKLSSYYDTALSDGYVDIVFEGHSHKQYLLTDEYGVPHLQNGGDNNGGITHAELQVHSINGDVEIRTAELIPTDQYDELEDSVLIAELLEKYKASVAPALQVYGHLETSVPGNDLKQIVADMYYLEGMVRWGSEYPIALGGGYINVRNPGYLARGEVTYADLMELFPFDNELVLCAIKGKDLVDRFLESDNYYICRDEVLCSEIDPDEIYYIVVDSYTSTYAPNRLVEIERYGEPLYARDLLGNYIANGGLN